MVAQLVALRRPTEPGWDLRLGVIRRGVVVHINTVGLFFISTHSSFFTILSWYQNSHGGQNHIFLWYPLPSMACFYLMTRLLGGQTFGCVINVLHSLMESCAVYTCHHGASSDPVSEWCHAPRAYHLGFSEQTLPDHAYKYALMFPRLTSRLWHTVITKPRRVRYRLVLSLYTTKPVYIGRCLWCWFCGKCTGRYWFCPIPLHRNAGCHWRTEIRVWRKIPNKKSTLSK